MTAANLRCIHRLHGRAIYQDGRESDLRPGSYLVVRCTSHGQQPTKRGRSCTMGRDRCHQHSVSLLYDFRLGHLQQRGYHILADH